MTMHIAKRLRRWGNSYGIPLSRAEVRELHAVEGDLVVGEVSSRSALTDFSQLTTYKLGAADDVDEILGDDAVDGR